ncbi:unnamed protein product [Arabidopsis halleri]
MVVVMMILVVMGDDTDGDNFTGRGIVKIALEKVRHLKNFMVDCGLSCGVQDLDGIMQ